MEFINNISIAGLANTRNRLHRCMQFLLVSAFCLASYSHGASSASSKGVISQGSSPSVDALFATATSAVYQDLAREQDTAGKATNLEQIINLSEEAIRNNDPASALMTIARNMPAIGQQINSPKVQEISALALSLHGTAIAQSLLTIAKDQGDNFSEARMTFELARYHADEAHWNEAVSLLKKPAIVESLAKEDAAEANLIIGTALQQQRKHREAMTYYEKIKSDSAHYRLAQLNLATANIRQDWWTDAQVAIQNALKINKSKKDEFDFRLYTVLGFSQIQYGFYRDARESFRNVTLTSKNANRALLGLGVAALHQEDFIGALNAFNHLRDKQENDISVAESYLLGAFALRQIGQHEAAMARYQEAVAYYEQLVAKQTIAASDLANKPLNLQSTMAVLIRPESQNNKRLRQLFEKIHLIDSLLAKPLSSSRVSALTNSKAALEKSYRNVAQKMLLREQETIQSYLSQSKFGLATLYDGN